MKETTIQSFLKMAEGAAIVPVYREIPGDMETPVSVLRRFADDESVVLLESVEGGETPARYSFLGVNPYGSFAVKDGAAYLRIGKRSRKLAAPGNPLCALRRVIGGAKVAVDPDLPPLPGGAIGCLNYEAAALFEPLPPEVGRVGTVCRFMLTDEIIAFDNRRHTVKVIVNAHVNRYRTPENAYESARRKIARLIRKLRSPMPPASRSRAAAPVAWKPSMAKEDFLRMVEAAKRHIVEGDIIQVVPSQAFTAETALPPFELYRALRLVNPSPYMFFLKLGKDILIGSSPETLVRLKHGVSEVRPIAGTRPRGADEAEDRELEASLLADEKERAEHLMLVDLGRNDIGRTAQPGTVKVTDFMRVERYSHVMHLVSDVRGLLRPECDAFDLVATAFPAGTLSGAPKIRAMEIIHELEAAPRGAYGGAVGYFSYDGSMDLAITIRTLEMRGRRIKVQAGCGIVADSVPETEYQETLNKARALFKAVEFAAGGLK